MFLHRFFLFIFFYVNFSFSFPRAKPDAPVDCDKCNGLYECNLVPIKYAKYWGSHFYSHYPAWCRDADYDELYIESKQPLAVMWMSVYSIKRDSGSDYAWLVGGETLEMRDINGDMDLKFGGKCTSDYYCKCDGGKNGYCNPNTYLYTYTSLYLTNIESAVYACKDESDKRPNDDKYTCMAVYNPNYLGGTQYLYGINDVSNKNRLIVNFSYSNESDYFRCGSYNNINELELRSNYIIGTGWTTSTIPNSIIFNSNSSLTFTFAVSSLNNVYIDASVSSITINSITPITIENLYYNKEAINNTVLTINRVINYPSNITIKNLIIKSITDHIEIYGNVAKVEVEVCTASESFYLKLATNIDTEVYITLTEIYQTITIDVNFSINNLYIVIYGRVNSLNFRKDSAIASFLNVYLGPILNIISLVSSPQSSNDLNENKNLYDMPNNKTVIDDLKTNFDILIIDLKSQSTIIDFKFGNCSINISPTAFDIIIEAIEIINFYVGKSFTIESTTKIMINALFIYMKMFNSVVKYYLKYENLRDFKNLEIYLPSDLEDPFIHTISFDSNSANVSSLTLIYTDEDGIDKELINYSNITTNIYVQAGITSDIKPYINYYSNIQK